MRSLCLHTFLSLALFSVSLSSIGTQSSAEQAFPLNYELSKRCPPGFSLENDNECRLRSLYQLYSSTQGQGVGGTKTSLPQYRDGFSPQQIDLGRFLFFDSILSGDQTISCATCHDPRNSFTDGLARSIGADGQHGVRSAPTLWNSAFLTHLNWDASANSFEQQVQTPLFSSLEMNNTPDNLITSLKNIPIYRVLFKQAFADGITLKNIYSSLAAFQASLISLNSRYDEYAHGNHSALNAEEIAGFNIFRSFVARCSECHTPPLFTNNQIAVIGVPQPENRPFDVGAELTFASRKLRGGFKVPTLRNISNTAPYMHQGNFSNLRDATEFYNKGRGHAAPKNNPLYLHWHINEPDLTSNEIDLLVTFMKTLEDEKFMPMIPKLLPSGLVPPN